MRIGVVIHYSETNYGNHLVNLAVRKILERRGYDVDLLNITGESRRVRISALGRTPLKLIRLLTSGVLLSRVRDRMRRSRQLPTVAPASASARKMLFQDFADSHLRPLRVLPEARHSLPDRYDSFAVGSDQIWNYDYGLAPWHFLDFADPSLRFTLSPSVGHESIPLEWRGFYRRMLKGFDEIGVRETHWALSLRPRSNVVLTVDPTLMITADEWRRVASENSRAADKVLVYELGSLTPDQALFIEETAKLLGTEVVHLSERGDQALWSSNAADFLALIDSAACVITDSYHGAIFSFLFDRPLVILQRHGFASAMNSRVQTLCERLHLQDRMIDALVPATAVRHDYSAGHRALVSHREEFEQYLNRRTQGRGI